MSSTISLQPTQNKFCSHINPNDRFGLKPIINGIKENPPCEWRIFLVFGQKSLAAFLFLVPDSGYNVFGTSADAIFATPDAYSRAHIVACVPFLIWSPSIFIHRVHEHANGPHLTLMGVPAKLEVDAILLRLLKFVRLVVEKDDELVLVDSIKQLLSAHAMVICSIVTANDYQVAHFESCVTQ